MQLAPPFFDRRSCLPARKILALHGKKHSSHYFI